MGAVWLGRDTVLGREVALKRIGMMPGATAPDLQRAEREARLAARLNHPHVVAVYDLVTEGEETWLVMEYVEGVSLSALIARDGALTPDEAAPLVRQAADALAAAHAAGIVHRDVKPSNMMVTPQGEVKLTDFGIARAEADASLTQTGLVTGSPAYLAPEVASGATAHEASDVWSLGATLFHALAGHTPYDVSENLMGGLYRIVHEEPPRLDDAGWLAPALEHTMTRDPAQRWSMAQVRDFLDQGRDVTIHPAPTGTVDDHGTRVLQPAEPLAVPPSQRTRRSCRPQPRRRQHRSRRPAVRDAAGRSGRGSPRWCCWWRSPSSASRRSPPGRAVTTARAPRVARPPRRPAPPRPRTRQGPRTRRPRCSSSSRRTWPPSPATTTPPTRCSRRASRTRAGSTAATTASGRGSSSATPSNIEADPGAMTVSYDVDYVKADGSTSSDHVTLDLVRQGSSYLIAGEA